jgi:hypothetical protein
MTLGILATVVALSLVGAQAPASPADSIGRRFGAQVMVEPGLTVPNVAATAKAATVDKALDALVAEMPGCAWRRIHVQTAAGKPVPTPASLAERVRATEKQAGTNLVIEKPAGGKATVLMANQTVTPAYRSDLARAQYRPVYLIFSTTPPQPQGPAALTERAPQEQTVVADVFGDLLGSFFSVDAVTQRAGMEQAMTLLAGLDSPSRAEFVTMMWRSMAPELQQDVVRAVMRAEQVRRQVP